MSEMTSRASSRNLQSRYTVVDFLVELARDAFFSAIIWFLSKLGLKIYNSYSMSLRKALFVFLALLQEMQYPFVPFQFKRGYLEIQVRHPQTYENARLGVAMSRLRISHVSRKLMRLLTKDQGLAYISQDSTNADFITWVCTKHYSKWDIREYVNSSHDS